MTQERYSWPSVGRGCESFSGQDDGDTAGNDAVGGNPADGWASWRDTGETGTPGGGNWTWAVGGGTGGGIAEGNGTGRTGAA